MARLYPPTIKDCSFYKKDSEENIKISIPFYDNPTVPIKEIVGYSLIIKTINTNKTLVTVTEGIDIFFNNTLTFSFNWEDENYSPAIGQLFKIQVAYISNRNTVGYYSTVAIARYSAPIKQLSIYRDAILPNGFYIFVDRGPDIDDPMLSYQLFLNRINEDTDIDRTSLATVNEHLDELAPEDYITLANTEVKYFDLQLTGENGHYEDMVVFHDQYIDPEQGYNYFLSAQVTTVNGLVNETKLGISAKNPGDTYDLILDEKNSIENMLLLYKYKESDKEYFLTIENNYDYGFVKFTRRGQDMTLYLSRYDEEGNFECLAILDSNEEFVDYNIEQGRQYFYTLGRTKFSTSLDNAIEIIPDYEDITLWDGEKLLRLKFNPQVTNYRTVKQENKIETLGGNYPFIFYNQFSGYKEFQVSGFLSMEMDEENRFLAFKDILKKDYRREATDTNFGVSSSRQKIKDGLALPNEKAMSRDSFYYERIFKNKVLDWLNNGKPKLFRSSQEGLFLVITMGVSMTPNDTIARKMHTVNMTVVEINELTVDNLIEAGIMESNVGAYDDNLGATNEIYGNIKGNNYLIVGNNTDSTRTTQYVAGVRVSGLNHENARDLLFFDANNENYTSDEEMEDITQDLRAPKFQQRNLGFVQSSRGFYYTAGIIKYFNSALLSSPVGGDNVFFNANIEYEEKDEKEIPEDLEQYYGILGTPLASNINAGFVIGGDDYPIKTRGQYSGFNTDLMRNRTQNDPELIFVAN